MAFDPQRHALEGVDVIIRFHDMSRLWELERAAFSLAAQEHGPVRLLVACQRLSEAARQALAETIGAVIAWSPDTSLAVLNYALDEPKDARSVLANLGFANLSGRYVGLLDYDDALYPEAYRLLVGALKSSGAAIAFARTPVAYADMHAGFLQTRVIDHPFAGAGLRDLLRGNFCPIHSYLLDRERVPRDLLRFEPLITNEEDYDFLLAVCAACRSDFSLINTDIGLYFYKGDGSNTFDRRAAPAPAVLDRMEASRHFIEARRHLLPLAPAVQRDLGIKRPEPGLTIRSFLRTLDGKTA
jgi:hypothetical protein